VCKVSVVEKDTEQVVVSEFLERVETQFNGVRHRWGSDYDNDKSAGFLLAVLMREVGELADVVIGDKYGEDASANLDAAQAKVTQVAGTCASFYELVGSLRAELNGTD